MLSRTKELLTMSRQKLRIYVDLLTEHATLRTHVYNLRLTEQREYWLCGGEKEYSIYIFCYCPIFICKRYRLLGGMFLESKDLARVIVNSLLSPVKNTRLEL